MRICGAVSKSSSGPQTYSRVRCGGLCFGPDVLARRILSRGDMTDISSFATSVEAFASDRRAPSHLGPRPDRSIPLRREKENHVVSFIQKMYGLLKFENTQKTTDLKWMQQHGVTHREIMSRGRKVDQLFVPVKATSDRLEPFQSHEVQVVAQRGEGAVLAEGGSERDTSHVEKSVSRDVELKQCFAHSQRLFVLFAVACITSGNARGRGDMCGYVLRQSSQKKWAETRYGYCSLSMRKYRQQSPS